MIRQKNKGLTVFYSFIIPHHNNPSLLNRLIDTIPMRDDVEIIIVDDNSDSDKKPVNLRSDCRVYWLDSSTSKGAGKARNVGMAHASGEWMLFADSDDMYADGFMDVLDAHLKDEIDILYFDVFYAWDLGKQKELWPQKYSEAIKCFLKNPSSKYWMLMVKHSIQCPWNFVVKSSYVRKINAKFEEIPKGNDAFFHHFVAMHTNRIDVVQNKLYYWLLNSHGLTQKKKTWSAYLEEIKCSSSHVRMKISAGAWDAIPPLHKGFAKVKNDLGTRFAIYWMMKKFFSGVPWLSIWLHKLFLRRR